MKVIGFLRKPVHENEIFIQLDKAMKLINFDMEIEIGNGKVIQASDIVCIEVNDVYTDITLAMGSVERFIRRGLNEWAELLPQDSFIRINNKFIVGCRFIDDIDGDVVKLSFEHMKLKMSRRRKKLCIEVFCEYDRKVAPYL